MKQSSILKYCRTQSKENEPDKNSTALDKSASASKKPKLAATSPSVESSGVLQEVPSQKNIPTPEPHPPNEPDSKPSSSSSTTTDLPVGCSEWMRKSVERWSLQPPYSVHSDELWKEYYRERAALDWRNVNAWDEAGKECPQAEIPGERFKRKEWYDRDKLSKWDLDWKQPDLKPLCAECYVEDMTERQEFEKLLGHIRRRVAATLSSCKTLPTGIAEAASSGSYILQYWINGDGGGDVRECHFETRFYVPVASGGSFEMHYRYYFRGHTIVELYTFERSIECCDAAKPTPIREWYPTLCNPRKANAYMVKLLSKDGSKKAAVHARKGVIQELVNGILGRGKTALSTRKTWALLARAGGVGAAGERSGVYFVDARRKMGKLGKKEESDEEEEGSEQCVIM